MVCLCHCTQLYKEPLHLQILSAQATALDGAGMTPTVLQCTTVRQEGLLPRQDTAISVHYRNIKFFGTDCFLGVSPCLRSSDLIIVTAPNTFAAVSKKALN